MFSTVAVIGAGTMGQGIAQLLVAAGRTVYLHDTRADALTAGVRAIEARLADADNLGRLVPCGSLTDLPDVDLAIEAAPEQLELKQSLFRQLDSALAPQTVLASNTSGLDIDALAAVTERADRIIGLHFFNPPPVMALIEVVPGRATAAEVVRDVRDLAKELGKTPIVVANRPGFVVNRLIFSMLAEAMRLHEEGAVSAQDIDEAMRLGAHHPIGPLALADFIGLDVVLDILQSLATDLAPHYAPTAALQDHVAAGDLGRKTGRGFFTY